MIGLDTTAPSAVAHALADRLVATLGDRPFVLTPLQLAAIGGGGMIPVEEAGPFERVVADRYAGLLASHLVQDVEVEGAPVAYARIWLLARWAFLQSLEANRSGGPDGHGLQASHGGAAGTICANVAEPLSSGGADHGARRARDA